MKKFIKLPFVIGIIFLIILYISIGCKNNKQDLLFGISPCDSSQVTYSITIRGIINNYKCLECHSGPTPEAGFSLENYTGVKAKVNDGRLIGSVNHLPGFIAMPQNGNMINDCDLKKIQIWLNLGAPNN